MPTVRRSEVLHLIACWVASGFGSGRACVAPGTWGSAAAVVFWWILQIGDRAPNFAFQLSAAVVVVILGWFFTGRVCRENGEQDPQWIVIDEWAGIFLTLLCVAPNNLVEVLAGFIAFRVFDIVKPGPVKWVERLPGATGIMADDCVAGLFAFSVMRAVFA
jgi:phosphatidylglycerophosphatase A